VRQPDLKRFSGELRRARQLATEFEALLDYEIIRARIEAVRTAKQAWYSLYHELADRGPSRSGDGGNVRTP
jgi:hypothetical protein